MSSRPKTTSKTATPRAVRAVTRVKTGAAKKTPAAPGDSKKKVARHVDQRVAARNSALNAFGGVKVDVFVRVRPRDNEREADQNEIVTVDTDESNITLMDPTGHPAIYTYDKVYGPDSTQEDVYTDCVSPIVEQVCRGLSCCIFAYGQTGAGKTYTMRGDLSGDESQHGIIQRSLVHLFSRMHEHDYTDIKVKASFLEVYNEELEDLLAERVKVSKKPTTKKTQESSLVLVDDENRGCVCKGLQEKEVHSLEEVMKLLMDAEAKCKYSETKMNKMSNRAHRIFTVIVDFKRYETPVTSTLTFVDLAGSEDISKSGATGMTAREAAHINKSLLTLGRVINALATNSKHIPYRDSKLTRLLSEALGGVCKTSFIACVGPCSGSSVESNSTLRYAERAMEALNISQLPRWKQDEIVIDGLTRRVQQLVDDMENMQKIHFEDMRDLRNERNQLKEENMQHKRDLSKAQRKIERLVVRKAELKSGAALLTNQKQNLLSEKNALQEELLETRSVRDGYLTDRKIMADVLGTVRNMRERLLAAHQNTESELTTDALALKKVIEGAIEDIEELHTEVERKKQLSRHNEQIADEFRDRMSSKLRGIVQSVNEFKSSQDTQYNKLRTAVADMKDTRQKQTTALVADVSKLNTSMASIFQEVTQRSQEIQSSRLARIGRGRDDANKHLQQLTHAVDKVQEALVRRLNTLREQTQELSSSLSVWSDKLNVHLDEALSSNQRFTSELTGNIQKLGAHSMSASNAQLASLTSLDGDLDSFLQLEKTALEDGSSRLIDDVTSYVKRMVTDFKAQSIRRTETAVTQLRNDTSSVSRQVQDLQEHQRGEFEELAGLLSANEKRVGDHVDSGRRMGSSQHQTAQAMLANAVATADETETDVKAHASSMSEMAKTQNEAKLKFFQEDQQAAHLATESVEKITQKGTHEAQVSSDALRKSLSSQNKSFASTSSKLDGDMVEAHDTMRKHVSETDEEVFDAEADAVNYVMQEIVRDVAEAPPQKTYTYPTEYTATESYPAILQDTAEQWEREVGILQGKLTAGKGTDFPNQPGPDDHSGLLTTTLEKEALPDEAALLDRAVYESSAEEYEDAPGFVDPMDRIDESSEDEEGEENDDDDDDDAATSASRSTKRSEDDHHETEDDVQASGRSSPKSEQ